MKSIARLVPLLCLASRLSCGSAPADELKFARTVIDDDFPGAYQVEIADVNGDKKPDIIAVGGSTCAWYENPSWKKRIISGPSQTPGIISSATTDLDGDGKAEVAIAYQFEMNKPRDGKLLLARQGANLDDPWTFLKLEEEIGSIHRLRWGKVSGPAKELVVAPLFGPEAKPPSYSHPSRMRLYQPRLPLGEGWGYATHEIRENRPVLHAIEVKDIDGDGRDEILTADNLGVGLVRIPSGSPGGKWTFTNLVRGNDATVPKGGASEIHLGSFADGHRFLATVEPWHGAEVAVYREKVPKTLNFGARTVIDNGLTDGHALWLADVDKDGTDEVFAGHRGGKEPCISVYRYADQKWHPEVLDRQIAAQDLRGGDLDDDGIPDIVAVGGTSHNVVWYKPLK